MKKNSQDGNGTFWKFLLPWVVFGLFIVFLVLGPYWVRLGSTQLSGNLHDWAQFGDYFTGVAGPLLSFLALCVVAYSIFKAHEESSMQLAELKDQNVALAKQLKISALTTAVDLLDRVACLTRSRLNRLKAVCDGIGVSSLTHDGNPDAQFNWNSLIKGSDIKSLYDYGRVVAQCFVKQTESTADRLVQQWELRDDSTKKWLIAQIAELDDDRFAGLIEGLQSALDAIKRMRKATKLFVEELEKPYDEISPFASLPLGEIKVARALSLALIEIMDELNERAASLRRKIMIMDLDLLEYRIVDRFLERE